MTNIVKQVVAIDVAQDELVVSLGRVNHFIEKQVHAYKTFANKKSGFLALTTWVKKHTDSNLPLCYVMEATGVYHQRLAYYLYDEQQEVSIVLPNKISNFIKTLDIKTFTDKTASNAICQFGLGNQLPQWEKPSELFLKLRQLVRERDQIIAERTVAKNQLHAEQAEALPNEGTLIRLNQRIDLFNTQEKEIRIEIAGIIKQDEELVRKIKRITTIPGVGSLTAVIVLAETNGFDLIRNKKQLASYSGLDVEHHKSGTSVNKKPKISKKGNKHLRKAMHMPALTAIQHDTRFKAIFARLVAKHGIKMKAAVVVQRKLLELIYTIWKTDIPYDQNYLQKTTGNMQVA